MRPMRLMKCLARSLVKNAGKALANIVPFGDVLCAVVGDTWQDYHRKPGEPAAEPQSPALMEEVKELIAAPAAEVVKAAEEAVQEVAAGLSV